MAFPPFEKFEYEANEQGEQKTRTRTLASGERQHFKGLPGQEDDMTIVFAEGLIHCTPDLCEQVWPGSKVVPPDLEPFADFVVCMIARHPLTTWARIFSLSGNPLARRQDVKCTIEYLAEKLKAPVLVAVRLGGEGTSSGEKDLIEIPQPDDEKAALPWEPLPRQSYGLALLNPVTDEASLVVALEAAT